MVYFNRKVHFVAAFEQSTTEGASVSTGETFNILTQRLGDTTTNMADTTGDAGRPYLYQRETHLNTQKQTFTKTRTKLDVCHMYTSTFISKQSCYLLIVRLAKCMQ